VGVENGVGMQVAKNSVLQQMCKQLQACGIMPPTTYYADPITHMRHPDSAPYLCPLRVTLV